MMTGNGGRGRGQCVGMGKGGVAPETLYSMFYGSTNGIKRASHTSSSFHLPLHHQPPLLAARVQSLLVQGTLLFHPILEKSLLILTKASPNTSSDTPTPRLANTAAVASTIAGVHSCRRGRQTLSSRSRTATRTRSIARGTTLRPTVELNELDMRYGGWSRRLEGEKTKGFKWIRMAVCWGVVCGCIVCDIAMRGHMWSSAKAKGSRGKNGVAKDCRRRDEAYLFTWDHEAKDHPRFRLSPRAGKRSRMLFTASTSTSVSSAVIAGAAATCPHTPLEQSRLQCA